MQLPADDLDPVLKRLRRAQGQLTAVIRMIEEEQDCRDVLTQLSACSKALDRAGFALISTGLQQCLVQDNPEREADLAAMEKLFLSLA
ncbi:metal-sensitive transcriptional regulator [Arsenicicoccus sp. oral taxon 190]|uniref:metal-sensitive transcriptional regulator n=1 Tax=Arsenicicoccus sp. oral taxon 190 TaxID=1658671 RepID=UPI00067A1864|nr:metal-sensitive transcriptional regulator [Arsenicicoccus sp. oral taxon 190]AKT50406.1 cytoplasmic protein [Arsenicicoccus sp. oral taxon 190]